MPELSFPLQAGYCSWSYLAADGGLLCFGASNGRGILVCNPMTNKWKELPSVSVGTRASIINHMILDAQRSSYKILFAGHATYEPPYTTTNLVDLYDSVSKTWKAMETLSTDIDVRSGAYCRDKFYILTLRIGVHTVVALDLTTLMWRYHSILVLEVLADPHILACSSEVYLVGGSLESTDWVPMANICIFVLECSKFPRWSKVCEFSNEPFLRSSFATSHFFGPQNQSMNVEQVDPRFMWAYLRPTCGLLFTIVQPGFGKSKSVSLIWWTLRSSSVSNRIFKLHLNIFHRALKISSSP